MMLQLSHTSLIFFHHFPTFIGPSDLFYSILLIISLYFLLFAIMWLPLTWSPSTWFSYCIINLLSSSINFHSPLIIISFHGSLLLYFYLVLSTLCLSLITLNPIPFLDCLLACSCVSPFNRHFPYILSHVISRSLTWISCIYPYLLQLCQLYFPCLNLCPTKYNKKAKTTGN